MEEYLKKSVGQVFDSILNQESITIIYKASFCVLTYEKIPIKSQIFLFFFEKQPKIVLFIQKKRIFSTESSEIPT